MEDSVSVHSDNGPFVLTLKALQGRWTHEPSNLTFTVRGRLVFFASGDNYEIETPRKSGVNSPTEKEFHCYGFKADPLASTASTIVWRHLETEEIVKWHFETDDEGLKEVDSSNILSGKRSRGKVDFFELSKILKRKPKNEDERKSKKEKRETKKEGEPRKKRVERVTPRIDILAQDLLKDLEVSDPRLETIFNELENLPVQVDDLKRTKIGALVNKFTKAETDISKRAKILIEKWKEVYRREAGLL